MELPGVSSPPHALAPFASSRRLDAPVWDCDLARAWRLPFQRPPAVIGSLTSQKLPRCKPLPGVWSQAAHGLVPASPRPRNRFSRPCSNRFSPLGLLSLSPTASRRRKAFNRTWRPGLRAVESRESRVEGRKTPGTRPLNPALDPRPLAFDRSSTLPGKFSRTKASSRPPTSSATG